MCVIYGAPSTGYKRRLGLDQVTSMGDTSIFILQWVRDGILKALTATVQRHEAP
jgi:hypothetical protein